MVHTSIQTYANSRFIFNSINYTLQVRKISANYVSGACLMEFFFNSEVARSIIWADHVFYDCYHKFSFTMGFIDTLSYERNTLFFCGAPDSRTRASDSMSV